MRDDFKRKLLSREPQVGIWLALASPYTAELCGHAGFDWYVIDAEHAPNDISSILSQLQALARFDAEPVLRIPTGDTALVKKALDMGYRVILAPMVETVEDARRLVDAVYYPPAGHRGVGSALARASAFGTRKDYLLSANESVCLICQVETRIGLASALDIAEVDGVSAIFIGAADLAADMGHIGASQSPEVVEAIAATIALLNAKGVPVGVLTSDTEMAREYLARGVSFVGVGNDATVLSAALSSLRMAFC